MYTFHFFRFDAHLNRMFRYLRIITLGNVCIHLNEIDIHKVSLNYTKTYVSSEEMLDNYQRLGKQKHMMHHATCFEFDCTWGTSAKHIKLYPWVFCFGLRILPLPVSVCLCVCVCGNHELVRAITHHPFKLGSPYLGHRCKIHWLRSLLFWGWLTKTYAKTYENGVYSPS